MVDCVDSDDVKHDMDCLPEKTHSDDSVRWGITSHEHYKILTEKDSDVKYFLCRRGTEPLEDAHDDHRLVLSVTLRDTIVMTQTTQNLGLRRKIKVFIVNPKYTVGSMPGKSNLSGLVLSCSASVGAGRHFGHPVTFASFRSNKHRKQANRSFSGD